MTEALGAFLEGAQAIEFIAAGLAEQDWAGPTPCDKWTAADLAGHVRCVADDYNAMLDCVLDGCRERILRGMDLAHHNAIRLAELAPAAPLVHVAAFGVSVRRFAKRAAAAWHHPMFHLRGQEWTVGDYVGFCAVEWHIHAWDLACSVDIGYRPQCTQTLATGWRHKLPHLPLGHSHTWETLLIASGREPVSSDTLRRRRTAQRSA